MSLGVTLTENSQILFFIKLERRKELMKPITLPKSLLLGSATAATQIEGGDPNNNWYHWGLKGKIANSASSITASGHYEKYGTDIALMKKMNHEIYRMSIEWSRIEPNENAWSEEGMAHYQDEIRRLINAGIKPLVTLHHFSHPQWFEEKGAWTSRESVTYFLRFVSKVIDGIGDMVSEYCTINEPNVFVNDTYIDGKYPPGKKDDVISYFKATKNLIMAHLKTYRLIHKIRISMGHQDTKVGFAHHLALFEVAGDSWLTKFSKKWVDYSFHQLFLSGMVKGHLRFPIGRGFPLGKGIFCDFIGVNYYSRHVINPSNNIATFFGDIGVDDQLTNSQKNDLGWEIYPEGLYKVIKPIYETYKLPIYITENGIADATDQKRSRFIYEHLLQVKRLIDDGVNVQRYYHWSLMDNLEWNDGYRPRFGLIEIDYNSLERIIRQSGKFYSEICKDKQVTEGMIRRYL